MEKNVTYRTEKNGVPNPAFHNKKRYTLRAWSRSSFKVNDPIFQINVKHRMIYNWYILYTDPSYLSTLIELSKSSVFAFSGQKLFELDEVLVRVVLRSLYKTNQLLLTPCLILI